MLKLEAIALMEEEVQYEEGVLVARIDKLINRLQVTRRRLIEEHDISAKVVDDAGLAIDLMAERILTYQRNLRLLRKIE